MQGGWEHCASCGPIARVGDRVVCAGGQPAMASMRGLSRRPRRHRRGADALQCRAAAVARAPGRMVRRKAGSGRGYGAHAGGGMRMQGC